MYQKLDVPKLMKALKPKEENKSDKSELLTGAFMINVADGENIKPTQKNGSSNPYVYIKVPEGTVVPPSVQSTQRKNKSEESVLESKPTILSGSACEILRYLRFNVISAYQ
jgi:hypothetical protein